MSTTPAPPGPEPASSSPPSFWPYVLPMGLFLMLTAMEGYLPRSTTGAAHPTWYPAFYAAKVALVAAVAVACRSSWRDLRPGPGWKGVALGVAVGIAVTAGWVLLERVPYPKVDLSGSREAFDPFTLAPPARAAFLAMRFIGLVVLVPLIEELFWRSFLMRWVIQPEFWTVPIGRLTPTAVAVTSGLFAAAHPEWLPALLTGLAWAKLLGATRSLSACALSHAVANLGLGLYVMRTGTWALW